MSYIVDEFTKTTREKRRIVIAFERTSRLSNIKSLNLYSTQRLLTIADLTPKLVVKTPHQNSPSRLRQIGHKFIGGQVSYIGWMRDMLVSLQRHKPQALAIDMYMCLYISYTIIGSTYIIQPHGCVTFYI